MELAQARSILTAATGFIKRGGFDWTCNPYVGCTFGCRYCYAMFLPQNRRPREYWGRWFQVKANAVELARRQAPRAAGQAVYMSSVTDPYQPVERALGLTRGILEALAPHQPRLVIQTRGPLVVRDADILARFGSVRVNLSIPTDDDEIRKAFEPKAPPSRPDGRPRAFSSPREFRWVCASPRCCRWPTMPPSPTAWLVLAPRWWLSRSSTTLPVVGVPIQRMKPLEWPAVSIPPVADTFSCFAHSRIGVSIIMKESRVSSRRGVWVMGIPPVNIGLASV